MEEDHAPSARRLACVIVPLDASPDLVSRSLVQDSFRSDSYWRFRTIAVFVYLCLNEPDVDVFASATRGSADSLHSSLQPTSFRLDNRNSDHVFKKDTDQLRQLPPRRFST
jgi:hypothetical protein